VPNATGEDLNALSRISLEYIVRQVSAEKEVIGALCLIVKELGLTNAAQVRPRDGSYAQFDLISFGNLGEQLDLMFCQHIPVTKLFNCHGLSLKIDSLIRKSSLKECKGSLELEYTNGWQALFDAVMGHLDVEDSETNYYQGWSKFISFVTRGKSCLNPNLKGCLTTQSQVPPKDILRAFPFFDDSYACIPLIINNLVMNSQEFSDTPLEVLFRDWGLSFSEGKESVFHRITGEIVSSAREAGLTCADWVTFLQVLAYQQASLRQDSGIGSIFCRVESMLGKSVMVVDIPYLKWRLSYCVPLITDETFSRFIALMNTPKKQCFERLFEIVVSQALVKDNVEKRSLDQLFVDADCFVEPLSGFGSYGVVLSFLLQKSKPLGAYTHKFLSAIAGPIPDAMKRRLLDVYLQKTIDPAPEAIVTKDFFFKGFAAYTKDELYFILVKDLLQSRNEALSQLAMEIWANSRDYTLSEEVKKFAVNTMYLLGLRKKNIRVCLDVLENCLTVKDYETKVDLLSRLSKGLDHNNLDEWSRKRVVALAYELVEGATNRVMQVHKTVLSDIIHWVAVVSINSSFEGAFVDLMVKAKDKKLIVKKLPNLENGFHELLLTGLNDETVDILKVVKLFEEGKRCGLFDIEKIPEGYFETLMTIAERCCQKGHVLQFEYFIGYLEGKSLGDRLETRRTALVLRYLEDVLPDVDAETLKRMITGKYSAFLSGEQKRDYRYQILVRSIDKNFALGSEIALEMLSESASLEWRHKALALYLDQLNRAVVGKANPLVTESLKILRHKNCGKVLSSSERVESLLKCLKLTDSKNSEQRLSLVVEALKGVGDDQLEVLEEPIEEVFRAIQNQRGAKTKGQQEFIEALRAHYPRFISFYHQNNQPEALLTFIKNSAIIGVREPNDEKTFLVIVEALVGPRDEEVLGSVFMPSLQDSISSSGVPRPPFAEAHCDLGCNIPVLRTSEREQKDDIPSKGSAVGLRSKGPESYSPGRSERQRTEAWVMSGKKRESCKDGIKNISFLQSFHAYLITNFKLLIGNIDNKNCFDLFCVMGDMFLPKEPEKAQQWISLSMPYETIAEGVVDKCFEWMSAIVQKDRKFTEAKLVPFLKQNKELLLRGEFDFFHALFEVSLEEKNFSSAYFIYQFMKETDEEEIFGEFISLYLERLVKALLVKGPNELPFILEIVQKDRIQDLSLLISIGALVEKSGNKKIAEAFAGALFNELRRGCKKEEPFFLLGRIIKKYELSIACDIILSGPDLDLFIDTIKEDSEAIATLELLRTVAIKKLAAAENKEELLQAILDIRKYFFKRENGPNELIIYLETQTLLIKTLLSIEGDFFYSCALEFYYTMIKGATFHERPVKREELLLKIVEGHLKISDAKAKEDCQEKLIFCLKDFQAQYLFEPAKLFPLYQKVAKIEDLTVINAVISWTVPIARALKKEPVNKALSQTLDTILFKTTTMCDDKILLSCLLEPSVMVHLDKKKQSQLWSQYSIQRFYFGIELKKPVVIREAFNFFLDNMHRVIPNSDDDQKLIGMAWLSLMDLEDWEEITAFVEAFIKKVGEPFIPYGKNLKEVLWHPENHDNEELYKFVTKEDVKLICGRFTFAMTILGYTLTGHKTDSYRRKVKALATAGSITKQLIFGYRKDSKGVASLLWKLVSCPLASSIDEEFYKYHLNDCKELISSLFAVGVFQEDLEIIYSVFLIVNKSEPKFNPPISQVARLAMCKKTVEELLKQDCAITIKAALEIEKGLHESLTGLDINVAMQICKSVVDAIKKRPYDQIKPISRNEEKLDRHNIQVTGKGVHLVESIIGLIQSEDGVPSIANCHSLNESLEFPLFRIFEHFFGSGVVFNQNSIVLFEYYANALVEIYATTPMPEGNDIMECNVGIKLLQLLNSALSTNKFDEHYGVFLRIMQRFLPHALKLVNEPLLGNKYEYLVIIFRLINSGSDNMKINDKMNKQRLVFIKKFMRMLLEARMEEAKEFFNFVATNVIMNGAFLSYPSEVGEIIEMNTEVQGIRVPR
jgi:hypothetical protein